MDTQVGKLQSGFLSLKFGMFIHYNMATYRETQWTAGYPAPREFNPGGRIDTDAWAEAALSAGMTYGVLTAKHVGGFCLWDSPSTRYKVTHSDCPYGEDLVAQFVESFTRRRLKAGLYYCWRNPGFGDPGRYKVLPPECDPATHGMEEQIEFQKAQIAELLSSYPDVFYIWNDGYDPEVAPPDDLLNDIRAIRPTVIASANWWDWGRKGEPYLDIAVTETKHFPEDNGTPGETCWCLEDHWFWHEGTRTKPAADIARELELANARNANFLLNVGPNKHGRFSESSLEVLAELGGRKKSR